MFNCIMRLKVLIVEYDQFQADLLEAYIAEHGQDVTSTLQPDEALRLVSEAHSCNNPFDAVFMEFMLSGTNGIDLCKKLKNLDPDLTVNLVTADNSLETRMKVARQGDFAGFIDKAGDISQLEHHLNIALSNKKARLSGEKSEYLRRMKQAKNTKA